MKRTSSARGASRATLILLLLVAATSVSAQDLAVLQARSLDDVFDGIETVSEAVGKPFDRQMLMGQATAMLGVDPGEFLDSERPVVVVMPVQGMMLQQNGFVASVPVTDSAAAIDAVGALFDGHSTEDDLHVFSRGDQPLLYLVAADGYLRAGGNRDLVTGFDPPTKGKPGADLTLEIFLEPVAPMVSAGLQAAKQQVTTELESELEEAAPEGEEAPYDPAAVGPMLDLYLDGVQNLLANMSSLRLAFDVDAEHLRMSKTLVAKPESGLAGFCAAQTSGLPEIAKLAAADAAMYAAGRLTFDDEQRRWLKDMADRYMDVSIDMFETSTGPADAGESGDADADPARETAKLWRDYMTAMAEFSDRWVDCWRGDMVVSFDIPRGHGLTFTEAFGIREDDSCRTLIDEMGDRIGEVIGSSDELSSMMTIEDGPRIEGSTSLVFTMDIMEMVAMSGQPVEAEAGDAIEALYGEKMTVAMVTADDHVLVTGGAEDGGSLEGLVARLAQPRAGPSFAPLKPGASVLMLFDIGRLVEGLQAVVPEDELDLDGPAGKLRGEAGRIPVAVRFGDDSATFETALSMSTISTFAEIAAEERAEAAEAAETDAAPVAGEDG